jgi:hypothetical protein
MRWDRQGTRLPRQHKHIVASFNGLWGGLNMPSSECSAVIPYDPLSPGIAPQN